MNHKSQSINPAKFSRKDPNLTLHQRRVYHLLSLIPVGKVTTYGQIAKALGNRGARAVGNTLNRNPFAPMIPCHRVVNSNGKIGGYAGGLKKKVEILRREGVFVEADTIVNFTNLQYRFTLQDVASAAALAE